MAAPYLSPEFIEAFIEDRVTARLENNNPPTSDHEIASMRRGYADYFRYALGPEEDSPKMYQANLINRAIIAEVDPAFLEPLIEQFGADTTRVSDPTPLVSLVERGMSYLYPLVHVGNPSIELAKDLGKAKRPELIAEAGEGLDRIAELLAVVIRHGGTLSQDEIVTNNYTHPFANPVTRMFSVPGGLKKIALTADNDALNNAIEQKLPLLAAELTRDREAEDQVAVLTRNG